jgi:DNA mismatch repair ATPase MutS
VIFLFFLPILKVVCRNRHLNLLMMKGERPHAGFPERSFGKYAERLVQLGFKVARVEQVETPNDLKERNMTTGSKSKVRPEKKLFFSSNAFSASKNAFFRS